MYDIKANFKVFLFIPVFIFLLINTGYIICGMLFLTLIEETSSSLAFFASFIGILIAINITFFYLSYIFQINFLGIIY
ncbi:hypothetical protein CCY99_05415 [Helicobacter sp. 16-1353]|nr:hypothetical protein CCY99_05415 [Helicobacter sp. 16-1353]